MKELKELKIIDDDSKDLNEQIELNNNDNNTNNINKIEIKEKKDEALELNIRNISIYQKFTKKNNELYLDRDIINSTQNYEDNIFNKIEIEGDGNCLYHCVSYHLFGTQIFDENIRLETYNYIKQNKTFIYEYCYVENNTFYLDIEQAGKKIKYFIEDYIENIKKYGFYGGFIELYVLSKLYNLPIVLLINEINNDKEYYKKFMIFNQSNNSEYKLENILFLLYVNENHYQYLEPNMKYINYKVQNYYIDKVTINLEEQNGINSINPNSEINKSKELKVNKTKEESIIDEDKIKRKIETNKQNTITTLKSQKEMSNHLELKSTNIISNGLNKDKADKPLENKENKKNKKGIIDSQIYNLNKNNNNDIKFSFPNKKETLLSTTNNSLGKTFKNKNISSLNKKTDIKNKLEFEIHEDIPFDLNCYKLYLNYCKKNRFQLYINKNNLIEVSEYPILIGNRIKINYYNDIFKYLYLDKLNFKNVSKYPQNISKIKDLNIKEKKNL